MAKSYQRYSTLQTLGVNVRGFDFDTYFPTRLSTRITMRLAGGRFPPMLVEGLRRDLLEVVSAFKPDILWMEKCWLVTPGILQVVKDIRPTLLMVSYQTDDPFGTRRRDRPYWKDFLRCLPIYDAVFVVRSCNIGEFRNAGAKNVTLTRYGFHESFSPRDASQISPDCRHDVVFVGSALDRRVRTVQRLLLRHKLPLHVYGGRWNRTIAYYLRRGSFHSETVRYPEIINGSKICLGFVSWSNRDEYTERSIDVPACGGFLLAERTPKHQELYEEGSEAEFFDDDEECAEKIRYYLRNEEPRQKIAAAGCSRCRRSEYTMAAVVKEVLNAVMVS